MTGLVEHLAGFGDRQAIVTATERLTYRALADRVAESASRLGAGRRLVLIPMRNETATLATYLGALAAHHVVLSVPPDRDVRAIVDSYGPDAVACRDGTVTDRAEPVGHLLHDDLALVTSTSGSTGSPKLVRLSRTNLTANAAAISAYLGIDENDRAATTLPISYCYGLSVVHSHLLRGAALILTHRSVVDDEFWDLFTSEAATSFAGVPYTFDMLDRTGFADMRLPSLRYVTQAGGRLDPDRVRGYAQLGRRRGWDFYVMYGATEATARMAYLPPDLAASHPGSIGRAIPGGSFTLEPLETPDGGPEPDLGELVYRGPNVMMGYAHCRADLALGATVHQLRTGDIARRDSNGLYEVIGRRARFVKLYGLRVDLQRVEHALRCHDVSSLCTDDGDRLAVAIAGQRPPGDVAALAASAAGVPPDAVTVVAMPELPVLSSGKPDYAAVRAAAHDARHRDTAGAAATGVRGVFADVLHVDPADIRPDSTFLSLGGTSLNYVAASVLLEPKLGRLPAGWQQCPVGDLERLIRAPGPPRRWFAASLETSVALRAAAIVLIVGSHAGLFHLWGGAHILLGIAGYNFGRFCLTAVPRAQRIRHLRTTIAWIAVPSIAWIAVALAVTNDYHWTNLLLANKILGPFDSMTAGRLWFVEVLVYVLVALTLVCAIPAVDRFERRYPFGFAAAFLALGLALRYDLPGFEFGHQAWFSYPAFWFFAAGWTAGKAGNGWQRLAVSVTLAVCLVGYFDDALRGMLVLAGLLLLIWAPALRAPAPLPLVAGIVAEASLYTYLTHFQVYAVVQGHPLIGVLASIGVGIAVTKLVSDARRWRRRRAAVRTSDTPPLAAADPVGLRPVG